ncbi:hypothetical protein PILCRDRAFT_825705 [Piloderma croceum F 1598]|uniref:Uncharacterized protein n=1 Tax=Piloderma croceum (strain F 1598) TaxID=765440 RepID=A0A0C3BII2_PILCF|nr:hypothetical protein PILCRDRAFT_825705 [Piloderma croceum F 1598]
MALSPFGTAFAAAYGFVHKTSQRFNIYAGNALWLIFIWQFQNCTGESLVGCPIRQGLYTLWGRLSGWPQCRGNHKVMAD